MGVLWWQVILEMRVSRHSSWFWMSLNPGMINYVQKSAIWRKCSHDKWQVHKWCEKITRSCHMWLFVKENIVILWHILILSHVIVKKSVVRSIHILIITYIMYCNLFVQDIHSQTFCASCKLISWVKQKCHYAIFG